MKVNFMLKVEIGIDQYFVYHVTIYYLLINVFDVINQLHLIVNKYILFNLF